MREPLDDGRAREAGAEDRVPVLHELSVASLRDVRRVVLDLVPVLEDVHRLGAILRGLEPEIELHGAFHGHRVLDAELVVLEEGERLVRLPGGEGDGHERHRVAVGRSHRV